MSSVVANVLWAAKMRGREATHTSQLMLVNLTTYVLESHGEQIFVRANRRLRERGANDRFVRAICEGLHVEKLNDLTLYVNSK